MDIVQSNEFLARFITSEGWISQKTNRPKGDAFMPRKDHKIFKTSVTRHDGKTPDEIKNRGNQFLAIKRSNPINLYGWADVVAGVIRSVSVIPALDIEVAPNTADPNHANIIGWDLDFGKQWLQAEEIAQQSSELNSI